MDTRLFRLVCCFFGCLFGHQVLAFQNMPKDSVLYRSNSISEADFNPGNVQEVYGMINHLFSGVLITKPGSNPNENFDVRVRGISTLQGRSEPLIVIDGIVGAPIDGIDINDVESVTLIKGPETALYGIQGGSGVLEISTKSGSEKAFALRLNSAVNIEQKIYTQKARGAESFLAVGGADLGSNIDWMEYITQTGVSSVNNLALDGSSNDVDYRFSVNSRLINGILKDSGYDQFNLFGHAKWKGFSDKLTIEYTGAWTSKQSNIGFSEVFLYAFDANPTMPKYFASGDVYQALQFDAYNPVGFFELISKTGEDRRMIQGLSFKYDLNSFSINLRANFTDQSYAQLTDYNTRFFYYSTTLGESRSSSRMNKNIALDLQKSISSQTIKLDLNAGVKRQSIELSQSSMEQAIVSNEIVRTETEDEDKINLTSAFLGGNLRYKDWGFFNFRASVENSSALGDNAKAGLFYFVNMGADVLKKSSPHSLVLSAGIGKSGLTPYDDDATMATIGNQTIINPDLTYETFLNSQVSATFIPQNNWWSFSLTRYSKIASDLIRQFRTESDGGGFFDQTKNADELKNTGWELELGLKASISDFQFNSNLNLTTLTTEWKKIEGEAFSEGYLGCGCSGVRLVRYEQGLPFGAIQSPQLRTITADGEFVMVDQNEDGQITIEDDQLVQGHALPKTWIGWRNSVSHKNTILSVQFDATLGHSITNFLRFERATEDEALRRVTNTLEDNYGVASSLNQWSDIFVEDGSYFKLSYVQLSQKLALKKVSLTAALTANNLFTFSDYTGNDSSVRLKYQYGIPSYDIPGIQSRNEWFPSRSYTVSISVIF